jgi:Cu(I)/Ag(I) efflux system membrane fusion protein
MIRISASTMLLLASTLTFGLSGCNSQTPTSDAPSEQATDTQADSAPSEMDKVKAELAKLPPEDAASAEAQKVCPVSDEMLGTMGAPKKIDVNGQDVWICCDGCKDTLLASPDEYLAKLKTE